MMLWRTQELEHFPIPWRNFVPQMVMEGKVMMLRMRSRKRIKRMKKVKKVKKGKKCKKVQKSAKKCKK
jgi:hypothetical protein